MKKFIKRLTRAVGYEIRRQTPASVSLPSTKTKDLTLYKTLTGDYFLPNHAYQDIVANTIKSGLVFEKEVVDLACSYIKENTAVLDLGSNFGQMSILFAKKVGTGGKVYAFEADDFVYSILVKNIEANGHSRTISATFGAVHDQMNETLYFPEQDFSKFGAYGSFGIDYNADKGRIVQSLTVDSLDIQEPVSFMKVDIQGGDLQGMRGAVNLIEKNRMPILFEYEYHFEEEYGLCFQDYVDFVCDIGYKFKKVVNGHNYLILPKEY